MPTRHINTVIGLIAAGTCLLVGIAPHQHGLLDPKAIIIVVGGGLAIFLVAYPLQQVVNTVGVVLNALIVRLPVPTELIERMVGMAETARREGIVALEKEITAKDDHFLSGGVRLAVDGTEPDLIMDILETELTFIKDRHLMGQGQVRFVGQGCLAFGGLGALLMLALQPGLVGGGLGLAAQAALPLSYGLAIYTLTEAVRRKLMTYGELEVLAKRMIIEGVMSIQQGDNPRIVEHKLAVFLAPAMRPSAPEEPASSAPPPMPDGKGADEIAAYAGQNQERILTVIEETIGESDYLERDREEALALVARTRDGDLTLVMLLARLERDLHQQVLQALKRPLPVVSSIGDATATVGLEDIKGLTDDEIQTLLREVDQADLVTALKGASRELVEKTTGVMSERVRNYILDAMSYRHPTPADILMTQARIVAQVLKLAEAGQIKLGQ